MLWAIALLGGLVVSGCKSSPTVYIDPEKPLSDEEEALAGFYDGFELKQLMDAQGNPIPYSSIDPVTGETMPVRCKVPPACKDEDTEYHYHMMEYLKNHGIESVRTIDGSPVSLSKNFTDYRGNRLILFKDRTYIRWEKHELSHVWQKGLWQIKQNKLEFLLTDANRWAPPIGSYFRSDFKQDVYVQGERNQYIADEYGLTIQSEGDGWYREPIDFKKIAVPVAMEDLYGIYKDGDITLWINEFGEFTYEHPKQSKYLRGKFLFNEERFYFQVDRWKGGKSGKPQPNENYGDYALYKPYTYIRFSDLYQVLCQTNICNKQADQEYSPFVVEDVLLSLVMRKQEDGRWILLRKSNYPDRDGTTFAVLEKYE